VIFAAHLLRSQPEWKSRMRLFRRSAAAKRTFLPPMAPNLFMTGVSWLGSIPASAMNQKGFAF